MCRASLIHPCAGGQGSVFLIPRPALLSSADAVMDRIAAAARGQGDRGPKRRRITRACNFCRLKKLKCDGGEPRCSTCEMHRSACDYSQPNRKRGVPAGHLHLLARYRSLAEYVLGRLVAEVPGIEDAVKAMLSSEDAGSRQILEEFQAAWRQSNVYTTFEGLVAESDSFPSVRPSSPEQVEALRENPSQDATQRLDEGNRLREPPQPDLETQSSTWSAPAASQNATLPCSNLGRTTSSPIVVRANPASTSPILPPSDSTTRTQPDSHVRFPHDAAGLLESYFVAVHSAFPLLDKISMLQFFHSCSDNKPAICQAGAQDEQLVVDDKTSMIWSSCALAVPPTNAAARGDLVTRSHAYARQLIPSTRAEHSCTMARIQSLLLYSASLVHEGAWNAARESITLICDLAVRGRLFDASAPAAASDGSSGASSVGTADGKSKRKAWSSCFLLDTLIASKLNLLPAIQSRSCEVPSVAEDGWEEWDTWVFSGPPLARCSPARATSTYNQLIRLVHTFNTYITTATFYANGRDGCSGGQDIALALAIKAYRLLCTSTQTWVDGLPAHLTTAMIWTEADLRARTAPLVLPPPYVIGLNIAYHAFISVACRSLLNLGGSSSSQHQPHHASAIDAAARRLAISSVCVDALSKMYSSHYGAVNTHPFLHALVEFAECSDATPAGSTEPGQSRRRRMGHTEPSPQPSAQPDSSRRHALSSSPHTLGSQLPGTNNSRQLSGWFGDGATALDGGQRLSVASDAHSTVNDGIMGDGLMGLSGDTVSSMDQRDISQFEGSAEISSLGLLDYSR